jgi:hypothetical protein
VGLGLDGGVRGQMGAVFGLVGSPDAALARIFADKPARKAAPAGGVLAAALFVGC